MIQKARRAHLSPRAYHSLTTAKTMTWEFEQELEGLGKILGGE